MTTYALPISDDLAALLADAPVEQRRAAEQAAVEALAGTLKEHTFPEFPQPLRDSDISHLPQGTVDAIREGLTNIEAGRFFEGEEFLTRITKLNTAAGVNS